ncbi:hypothetical protein HZC53_00610 [Candidatus Uhrbacteria bacterium]|nr:hypothetical protein [Candidatus Uhrbacteria bacterium]
MTRKRATQDQIGRIVSMLVSRQIDFDEAQAIIRKYGKKKTARAPKEEVVTQEPEEPSPPPSPAAGKDLAFWEKLFFGKGAALMEVVGPLCSWRPELKPALPDLEKRAKDAVFWRKFKGIRCIVFSLREKFNHSVRDSLSDSLKDTLQELPHDSYRGALEDVVRDLVWSLLYRSIYTHYSDSLSFPLLDSLQFTLVHACSFAIAGNGKEAAKFRPFFELWLAGNLPVGFDRDGNLLVLVAD